jgi:tRNA(adenine34) deaminase
MHNTDIRHFLEISIQEAEKAFEEGNYPIGSLIVDKKGTILSQKRNQCSTFDDVTAHAEILNLREVGMKKNDGLIMFSSLEPCYGCSFFIDRSEIIKIYSALKDPHKGGMSDLKSQSHFSDFFNKVELINEPFEELKEKSKNLMKEYFIKLGREDKAEFYGYTVK